ncbi:concanavalin A-like lectin/glucanase domain-containing protein, partial [Phyllosticta citricarpa]
MVHDDVYADSLRTRSRHPSMASGISTLPAHPGFQGHGPVNPFATPPVSTPVTRPATASGSAAASLFEFNFGGSRSSIQGNGGNQPYFRSRRTPKGSIETPRASGKSSKDKWLWIIPVIGLLAGVAISGVLVYLQIADNLASKQYCSILNEDFSSGRLDPSIWETEVRLGGFGNGEFDETTADESNLFIKDGQLYIKPTLQDASLVEQNSIIDLTKTGTCTSGAFLDCVAVTNVTNGTIVPPVRSARLNTRKSASMKYGRVEVRTKIPQGDWLWPAIWMLPTNNAYGAWPASGEIDIMESRGNNYTYQATGGGNQVVQGTLHWGPGSDYDGYSKTTGGKVALHSQYGDKFHTFGLEWTEKYLFTYIDSRLLQVLYMKFDKPLWDQGHFPIADANGTRLTNPWANGGLNAPFDQEFYLVLNVAVGGTNGWFPDGKSSKPWIDNSPTAKKDFWDARNQWYPTWEKNGQMIVDSVKIWKE